MKKVLLCSPFVKGDLFQQRFVTPALGVWRLASYLSIHGHKCVVYDGNDPANKMSFPELVKSEKWDIIGFSVLTATLEYDMAKIYEAKKLAPEALILAGGNGAALNYQYVLDNAPVDIVMVSEGEYPLLDLCNEKRWQDIDGIVFKKKAKILTPDDYWEISKDLDVKGMHADKYWRKTAQLYDDPDYNEINTFRLFTTNYCPMGCKFCTLTLWKKYASGCKVPIVALNPEQVMELVHNVISAYPDVKQIFFVDDDFFLLQRRALEFLKKVIEEKNKGMLPEDLRFICLSNINRINKGNIELIAKAGVHILSIGVESTSQFVLESLNKKQTVEKIWENTQLILSNGIKPYYTLLMFTPYGRVEDLLTDLNGFRKLRDMGAGLSIEPYLIPLPGTPLWEERVPERTRWVHIEGTDKKIKKGFAWLPIAKDVRAIFDEYEGFFPKYKKYRYDLDGVGHKEKNYTAGIMLDALELVLKVKFGMEFPGNFDPSGLPVLYERVNKVKDMNVDIVGDFTEKEEGEFLH